MVDFMLWFLESSLLILFVLGIRKIFSGKISYRAIYALWLVVVFRFMIPVNIIPTPFGFADRNIFCSYKRDFSTSICSKFLFA